MKLQFTLGIALTAVSLASTAAVPAVFDDLANVTQVSVNTRDVTRMRRVCQDVLVEPEDSGHSVVGTVLGGVAGGLLGNQIGKGNGRTVSTAAGAVIGSVVGNKLSNSNEISVQTRNQCRDVKELATEEYGYLVTYQYQGRSFQTIYQRDPGPTIRVSVSVKPR